MQLDKTGPAGIGGQNSLQRQQQLLQTLQQDRKERQQQRQAKQQQQRELDAQCSQLRNRLKNYEEVDYVFRRDDKGDRRRLSSDQNQREIRSLQQALARRCR